MPPLDIVAWRLPNSAARVYRAWPPEAEGTWRSRTLDVWFVSDPPFLRVRGNDGRLLDPLLDTTRRARRLEKHASTLEEQVSRIEEHASAMERQVGDLQERNRQLEAELQQLRQNRDRRGGNASGR